MRVLYFCHRVPYPPNKGEKIRAFHQLRAMAERHEVDLFALADDADDLSYQQELQRMCRRVTLTGLNPSLARLRSVPYLLTRTALTLPYFRSADLAQEIRKTLLGRSFDRIFVYCSAMAQYVDWTQQIPVLTDLVDVDSDKWTQYAGFARFPFSAVYRREGRYLREYEREVCQRSSCVLVSTEREAELVRQVLSVNRVHVVTNGVDTSYFDPRIVPPDAAARAVVFTGDMSYFPNEEAAMFFAHNVLPVIRRSVPDVRFLVVGRKPGARLQRLRKLEGVEVTGFVPDIRTYLAKAQVSVAPFSMAAGIPNKILEAMAYGLPVVATSRAVQGLSRRVAEGVETADTAEALAERIVRLLKNPHVARERGMECRRRVAEEHNWGHALDRLLGLLENPEGTEALQAEHSSCPS